MSSVHHRHFCRSRALGYDSEYLSLFSRSVSRWLSLPSAVFCARKTFEPLRLESSRKSRRDIKARLSALKPSAVKGYNPIWFAKFKRFWGTCDAGFCGKIATHPTAIAVRGVYDLVPRNTAVLAQVRGKFDNWGGLNAWQAPIKAAQEIA
jgi:hypothetical protein